MSEYQYYEFLALDRPLSTAEQAEARGLSTRATITATSFTNEYQWGDFKGSPDELIRRHHDAHLYFANWGTHRVMFRLPRTLLDPGLAEQYGVDPQVSVSATRDHLILDMTSEDEPGYSEEDQDVVEPPVPAGLGSLTASQRALVDFLRVDADLLGVAAGTSPALPAARQDPDALAAHIAAISATASSANRRPRASAPRTGSAPE